MNPNANQPGFELPTPQPVGESKEDPGKSEMPQAANLESSPRPTIPANQPTNSVPSPVAPSVPDDLQAQASSPAIADDNDLIEKEWVQKAKQIVAETKNDPYNQNKQISRFKADYLKKRYNKEIKIEES